MRHISATNTAKLLRRVLRREFDGTKFSVRTKTFSGGASVTIRWTDGPTEAQVQGIARNYKSGRFDAMTDLQYSAEHYLMPDGTAFVAREYGASHPEDEHVSGDYLVEELTGQLPEGAERVHFGAKFIHVRRTVSDGLLARLESWAEPNGRVRMPMRGACGHWLPEGDCYTAPADGRVEFVCSPECGARVSARYVDARDLEALYESA